MDGIVAETTEGRDLEGDRNPIYSPMVAHFRVNTVLLQVEHLIKRLTHKTSLPI